MKKKMAEYNIIMIIHNIENKVFTIPKQETYP